MNPIDAISLCFLLQNELKHLQFRPICSMFRFLFEFAENSDRCSELNGSDGSVSFHTERRQCLFTRVRDSGGGGQGPGVSQLERMLCNFNPNPKFGELRFGPSEQRRFAVQIEGEEVDQTAQVTATERCHRHC